MGTVKKLFLIFFLFSFYFLLFTPRTASAQTCSNPPTCPASHGDPCCMICCQREGQDPLVCNNRCYGPGSGIGVKISEFFSPATTFPTLGGLVNVLSKNIMVLAGVLLFVLLIFGGLQFMISSGGGDEQGMNKGKNAITAAIIGFLLIFAAYWLVEIIQFITGISIFNSTQ